MKRRCVLIVILASVLSGIYAQSGGNTPAERYFLWLQNEINAGRWEEAAAALARADDFSEALSDISFVRALVYARENRSRWAVLAALEQAINVGRWMHYTEARARFMAAEYLIALRRYANALVHLQRIPESADVAVLKLSALKGLCAESVESGADAHSIANGDSIANGNSIDEAPALRRSEFRRVMLEIMDRYPRDPRPLKVFFEYAGDRIYGSAAAISSGADSRAAAPPEELSDADYFLLGLVHRHLPQALENDPELAWMAAPFIRNREEARRLLGAYRAGSLSETLAENFFPNPGSIPCALELSLISGAQATEELFAASAIDRNLIARVSELLAGEDSRNFFLQRLISYNGVISADDDRDGISESRALYQDGALREYYLDEDQDGITDLYISLINGVPQWARLDIVMDKRGAANFDSARAVLHWEQYPAVLRVEAEGAVYTPLPLGFRFAPLDFSELSGSKTYSGLLFPLHNGLRLERESLNFHALQIQRPSREFEGAVELIDMELGIPWRATEIIGGRTVSITEYERGQPALQRIDLDNDSRMETVRRFRKTEYSGGDLLNYPRIIESSQSDWDGDGIFEYAEDYLPDGSIVYSWDLDGSGIRNYSEIKTGNGNNETGQK